MVLRVHGNGRHLAGLWLMAAVKPPYSSNTFQIQVGQWFASIQSCRPYQPFFRSNLERQVDIGHHHHMLLIVRGNHPGAYQANRLPGNRRLVSGVHLAAAVKFDDSIGCVIERGFQSFLP